MPNSSQRSLEFPVVKRRRVQASFEGGDITSDGGVLLVQAVDRRIGLTQAIARVWPDECRQASCCHDRQSPLRQRIYGLALGYEDLNDHDTLRTDPAGFWKCTGWCVDLG